MHEMQSWYPGDQGYPGHYSHHVVPQEPVRRTWIGAIVYWNRYHKHFRMGLIAKALWWAKFLGIAALLPEGLVDAVSLIPGPGTLLLPVDGLELVPEGVGGAMLAWLLFKLGCKLVFMYRKKALTTFREIRDMRDYQDYPPAYYSRWVPRWMPV